MLWSKNWLKEVTLDNSQLDAVKLNAHHSRAPLTCTTHAHHTCASLPFNNHNNSKYIIIFIILLFHIVFYIFILRLSHCSIF